MRTGPITPLFIDLDARLKEMDGQGVEVHVLSLTQPMVYWADDDLGLQLCVAFNDAISAAHQKHPQRLFGFACPPFQNPNLALEELNRAAKLPGIRGVYIATVVRDRDLSDRSFFPVYARMEELGLPLFLHPMMINNERMKQYYLINLCGNPFETALAASHLIYGGVLDAFPKLEISLPHAGGALPILRGRLDRGFHTRNECKTIPRPPSEYLKRFTYDTISYNDKILQDLVDLVGADRILMGSERLHPRHDLHRLIVRDVEAVVPSVTAESVPWVTASAASFVISCAAAPMSTARSRTTARTSSTISGRFRTSIGRSCSTWR